MSKSDYHRTSRLLCAMEQCATVLILSFLTLSFQPTAWGQASPGPPQEGIPQSLSQAVSSALKSNLRELLAQERIVQSKGEKGLRLAALLPNISGAAYQANLTENLAALGLPVGGSSTIPAFIGPFNRFDARLQLFQSIFDLASIRRLQAGRHGVTLAAHEERLAAQQVVVSTTLAYLAVLEAEQTVAAAQANVQLGQRLLELATSQRNAGVATGVDVARAETRLASQRVQRSQAGTALDTARINLMRLVGAPLSQQPVLSDPMKFQPESRPSVEEAIRQALADRIELRVAEDQLKIAEAQRKAALADWMPSVSAFGDYGSSGLTPNEIALPTRSIGVRIAIPLYDGGRTRSQMQVASSQQRQAELRMSDLRVEVEKDVRIALKNLATREEQVTAAQKAVTLSERELELARDRFANGVGDNVEVVNAQTALENARQVYVSSLLQFNVARLNLAVALGQAENFHL
jgi:outer membrane protein